MKTSEYTATTSNLRKPYEAPVLEVYEYIVEQGYAVTNVEQQNHEEVSEIQDGGGNVFHGEWF